MEKEQISKEMLNIIFDRLALYWRSCKLRTIKETKEEIIIDLAKEGHIKKTAREEFEEYYSERMGNAYLSYDILKHHHELGIKAIEEAKNEGTD